VAKRSRGLTVPRLVATALVATALVATALVATGCSAPPPAATSAEPAATSAEPAATSAEPAADPTPVVPAASPAAPAESTGPAAGRPTPSRGPTAPPGRRPDARARPANLRYAFPVIASRVDYHPTHAKYPATDLLANCGSPVVAVTDGRVLEVSRADRYVKGRPDGPFNGGLFVSLLGDDGVRYYGSHLSRVGDGIAAGVRVRAGQRIGAVGRTGNANNVCHLHFGLSPACGRVGGWKVRRGVVWPSSFLDAWRRGQRLSPVSKVDGWRRSHGCQA
jgi:peptidoglycan LD-endopeptidase LytH